MAGEIPHRLSEQDLDRMLPHRRPFMFLQDVDVVVPGQHATGRLINRTDPAYEAYLSGHFPRVRIFPGFLLAEALAELAGIALVSGSVQFNHKIGVLTGADKMRWRQPIRPHDEVDLSARIVRSRGPLHIAVVQATKEGRVASSGEIMFALADIAQFQE